MKQAGRKHGKLSNGSKDPNLSHKGLGLDWDAMQRKTEERLDREWDEGLRNPDTIRQRWLKSLTPEQRKREDELLAKGIRTSLVIGDDGEPHSTQAKPEKQKAPSRIYQPGSGKTGRKRGQLFYDVDEIVRLYVEENMSPLEIEEKLGGKPTYPTIVSYLKKRGVFDPERHRTGGRRNRDSYDMRRQRYCTRAGHDLDIPGNSRQRVRKMPDGTTRPNGRECVPCARERSSAKRERDQAGE